MDEKEERGFRIHYEARMREYQEDLARYRALREHGEIRFIAGSPWSGETSSPRRTLDQVNKILDAHLALKLDVHRELDDPDYEDEVRELQAEICDHKFALESQTHYWVCPIYLIVDNRSYAFVTDIRLAYFGDGRDERDRLHVQATLIAEALTARARDPQWRHNVLSLIEDQRPQMPDIEQELHFYKSRLR